MTNTYIMLSKRIVGLFILLGIFSCGGEKFSSSLTITNNTNQQDDDITQQTVSVPPLLPSQVARVKSSLDSMVAGEEHRLILGVNNGENNVRQRLKNSDILLNEEHQNPFDKRSLTVDFNDLSQLQYLATQLPTTFDKIILDASVFKFTRWTREHLVELQNLLKLNGELIFAPQFGMMAPLMKAMKLEAGIDWIIEQTQLDTSETFITEYFQVPINLMSGDFIPNKLLRETFIPRNYCRILGQVFGPENIKVEDGKPLPFPTNIDDGRPVLITATRKIGSQVQISKNNENNS